MNRFDAKHIYGMLEDHVASATLLKWDNIHIETRSYFVNGVLQSHLSVTVIGSAPHLDEQTRFDRLEAALEFAEGKWRRIERRVGV
jgi:hypothetical protein